MFENEAKISHIRMLPYWAGDVIATGVWPVVIGERSRGIEVLSDSVGNDR